MKEKQSSIAKQFSIKRTMNQVENDEPCRSLVCDENGIIIAETVYKCMKCGVINDTIKDAKSHYYEAHIDEEIPGLNDFEITNNDDDVNIDTRRVNNFNYSTSNNNINNNNNSNTTNDSFSLLNDKRKRKRNAFQNGLSAGKYYETVSHDLSTETSDNLALNLSQKYFDENQEVNKLHYTNSGNTNNNNNSSKKAVRNYQTSDYSLEADWIKNSNILPRGSTTGSVGRAGYVSCAVCGVVRYYSCVYRRYGKFTCQVCYRFFRTFFTKPKVYSCANLGSCPLDVRVRCRACWILACTNLYTVRGDRKQILDAYRPRKADRNEMKCELSPQLAITGNDDDEAEEELIDEEEEDVISKTSESSNQLESKDSHVEQTPLDKHIKTEQFSPSN